MSVFTTNKQPCRNVKYINVTFETLLEYSGLFVAHFLIHL